MGHDYQVKNFVRVLKQLESCVQLQLVDDSLENLSAVTLPQCSKINAQKNFFSSFKVGCCLDLLALGLYQSLLTVVNNTNKRGIKLLFLKAKKSDYSLQIPSYAVFPKSPSLGRAATSQIINKTWDFLLEIMFFLIINWYC